MAIFSPSRCVLLLSDEGLNIFDVSGRVHLLDSIPWETQDFEEAASDVIKKKCRGKSVLILNDMVEQHYRKERVPKVSPFDKGNILKRRVSAAFPSYPIRAAIKLKEKAPAREGQPNGEIYLFAAVPFSENIRKTLDAVQKSYAAIAGFSLLPVESSSMIHALSKKLAKRGDNVATWTVFVGQHQSGGLRQIVTKNGELALTRMTPIIDTDIDQDVWTSEVANELKGTMSYLSRFGFDPSDGLDVVIIANNSVADRMVAKVDFQCNLSVLTSVEAANLLGIKIGRQEEQRYADPIHIAWAGRKSALTMPLQAVQLDKISGPARLATAASLLLLAGCAWFGYQAFVSAGEWASNASRISDATMRVDSLSSQHIAEIEKKKAAGVDFMLIESSTKVFDRLEKKSMKPLSVFEAIGHSLGADLHITSMEVKPVGGGANAFSAGGLQAPESFVVDTPGQPAAQAEYDVVIRIILPAELDPKKGVELISDLESRLKANLPQHSVSILKQVADLSYTGNFIGEATSKIEEQQGKEKQDYEAQIVIRGVMI
ncbi:MAG TPA: hypothetical protein VFS88_04745 [Micavibrio sp.]|nr:hypothetical protein [Micavibrio sp.]